ncbi:DUF6270 domain-containing protein [Capillimicrobium parvum]|uniref:Uncharacterized protein n=1 Tax=Capillimicrobium parvum TaxID=2884022 RepID=A0A9E6XWH4_9ACTN|nr:DUF6270 domain-containing protein [Capillimicrobium parvum]UGS35720.1 hypothetical protein DSM104329_02115 [Capillimicrobium parvum]
MTVAIFGSCVTRDVFEDPALRPSLGHYTARSSVISAVAPPLPVDEERVVLDSPFQRRCVLADLHKTFFDSLAEDPPDLLIVDLIDERFDLLAGAGTVVTVSSALQAAGLGENLHPDMRPLRRMSERGCELFAAAAPVFAARVTEIVPPERVILHRALWSLHYTDGERVHPFPDARLELCRLQNDMLDRSYDALADAFGAGVETLQLDPAEHLADAGHRWELEPFHYEASYNREAARRLQELYALR